jgi:hypothetical protein
VAVAVLKAVVENAEKARTQASNRRYDVGIFFEVTMTRAGTISRGALLGVLAFLLSAFDAGAEASLWQDVSPKGITERGVRDIQPQQARTMALDFPAMTELLAGAPLEQNVAAPDSSFELSLPLPEGGFARFRVVESAVMEPGLAKRFPMFKTYLGQGIDNPSATARLDITSRGFRAQVIANSHTSYIEPVQRNDTTNYSVFNSSDYRTNDAPATCSFTGQEII